MHALGFCISLLPLATMTFEEAAPSVMGTIVNPEGAPVTGCLVTQVDEDTYVRSNDKGAISYNKIRILT